MAQLARQLYFEAVKVGDELPPLVKPPVDRIQIARYAGASGDFNPLHVDEHVARNAGFPSTHAPAMLAMGFIGELVVDWLRGARLRRFTARFPKLVWPGDVITCRGRVSERRFEGQGVYAIDLDLWAENQRGELVLKATVTAQLFYSAEDDARQRGGEQPLLVTAEEEAARLAKLSRAQPPKRPDLKPPPRPPAPPPQPITAAAGSVAVRKPPPVPADISRHGTIAEPVRVTPPPGPRAVPLPSSVAPSPRTTLPSPSRTPSARPGPVRPPARPQERPAARRPSSLPGAVTERPAAARRPSARPVAAKARPGATHPRAGQKPHASSTRSQPKAPAARASRPRSGSKPTGRKRR